MKVYENITVIFLMLMNILFRLTGQFDMFEFLTIWILIMILLEQFKRGGRKNDKAVS